MLGQEHKDNTVVILSDDEEDEEKHIINENGKRIYYYETEDQNSEEEDEEDGEYEEGEVMYEEEEYEDIVRLSQALPEDHESAIFSERNQENPLQQLTDIVNNLKSKVLKLDLGKDEIETSFAIGMFTKDDVPNVAMIIEGVVGPIAFPLIDKDANLITNAHPKVKDISCFNLKTSHILLNQSYQEYIYKTILPDIYVRLGVDQDVINTSRMEAIQLYICKEGEHIELPKQHPKGSYGSALIILPSEYGGGEIETHYDGVSALFRPETESCDNSFYTAWYNDVDISTEPVAYGHQVSIYFSLICNNDDESINCASLQQERRIIETGELLPRIAAESKSYIDAISLYLKSIPETTTKYPVFYMLNYSYNFSSIRLCDINRSDKVIFHLMKKAAKDAGYSVYIASLSREVEASVKKESISENRADKEKDCPMDEEGIYLSENIVDDTLILTSLNDENGINQLSKPVSIDFKEYHPIIQGNEWYSRCKPDSVEYSGTKSTGEASVTYFYSNNTAVALIPSFLKELVKDQTQIID